MKFMRLMLGGLTAFLMLTSPAVAVELSISTVEAGLYDAVAVPIDVMEFTGVAGIQLHLEYDDQALAIDSVVSASMDGATINTGIAGQVHWVWDDFQNPISLTDGAALLTVHFHVIGSPTEIAFVRFFGVLELVDEAGDPLTLTTLDGGVTVTSSAVDERGNIIPNQFELRQNFPNPFNPSTTIAYRVEKASVLTFEVFNVRGQMVDRIDLGRRPAGEHNLTYAPRHLASGVYAYRIAGDQASQSKNMILIK